MLTLTVPGGELYDEQQNMFIYIKGCTIVLEHSLVSLSKWESKWHKPFISEVEKTTEEVIDYIKCMTITQNVDPEIYKYMDNTILQKVNDYIDNPMTATTISSVKGGVARKEVITSEIIYYQMIAYNIPFECQKWHLNRLLTLINVCNVKNNPDNKMSVS